MVENRFEEMYQKNYYENVIQKCNPRKYNSASAFSGCIQRDLSKGIIALPTFSAHIEIF